MGLVGDRTRAIKKKPGPREGAGPCINPRYVLLLELLRQNDMRAPALQDQGLKRAYWPFS
jgi:hypothetical protein